MKSPFPGMDPFIEASGLWRDFHGHLIEKTFDVVSDALPKGYLARTGKRSYLVLAESEEKAESPFEPDVSVTAEPRRRTSPPPTAEPATVVMDAVEPIALRAFIETEFEERFIDIYELNPERRLVTSIEVLSPSNKKRRTLGWKKYVRKRQALLLGRANLVEIDLLRLGERMPMVDALPQSPYYLLVARMEEAPLCKVWAAYINQPLPVIPIPLSKPDPDIELALQPLVDAIYERCRYGEEITYSQPLPPPAAPEVTEWLQKQSRAAARSGKPRASRKRDPRKQ